MAHASKVTSVLRRVDLAGAIGPTEAPGQEGDVCAFELRRDTEAIIVEAVSGRAMKIVPGDVFLAAPGHRESTRWVVGRVPETGLIPGEDYRVLAQSGVVGEFIGTSTRPMSHLGHVKYLGVFRSQDGDLLNIRQFTARAGPGRADDDALVFVVVGTSSEVGKTTAGIAILNTLLHHGHERVAVLKATGTSAVAELDSYRDVGAIEAFDSVDFGLPTTYPSDRSDIVDVFETALDMWLSRQADAFIAECGGDILGANVPSFLRSLLARRPEARIVLAASDSLAALGGQTVLRDMGIGDISLITGPCTDTPTIQRRTQALCRTPAVNMVVSGTLEFPL